AEKGTKHVPMAEVTALLTGVAALRLAGDAIVNLWSGHDIATAGDRGPARQELLDASDQINAWYEQMAVAVGTGGVVPEALTHDPSADNRLIEAVRRDLQGEDGQGTATAVKMIWTADHLDAARRLQTAIVDPARAVTAAQSRRWWHGTLGARRPAAAAAVNP
ncbi:MAG TPA: hypothetical protein VKV06_15045, partial [Acidimicrobiales bacterium]|nr:hypothetical protein [Acidimicrobiales bacterium]